MHRILNINWNNLIQTINKSFHSLEPILQKKKRSEIITVRPLRSKRASSLHSIFAVVTHFDIRARYTEAEEKKRELRQSLKAVEGKAWWNRERERGGGATFISTGNNTESAASSATAASGRHSGEVVNEQSFEPNMLSPIFNLSRCGARASASRFPVCQTGKPGQTFELAQTVWHPTTYRRRGPRILNMLLWTTVLSVDASPTCNQRTNERPLSVSGSLWPRNFLPPPLDLGRLKVQRWCTCRDVSFLERLLPRRHQAETNDYNRPCSWIRDEICFGFDRLENWRKCFFF